MQCQSIPEVAHDVIPVRPEADHDGGAAVHKHPDRHGGARGQRAGRPDQEDGAEGADGVGDVVGAVREGRDGAGQDLQEGVEVLGFVVVVEVLVLGVLHCGRGGEPAGAGLARGGELLGDDVDVHAVEEVVFGAGEEVGWFVPFAVNLVKGFAGFGEDVRVFFRRFLGVVVGVIGPDFVGGYVLFCVLDDGHVPCVDVGVVGESVGHLCWVAVAAIVILHDLLVVAFWLWRDGTATPEERSLEHFPGLQGPVFLHKATVQEGEEENAVESDDAEGNAKDTASDLTWHGVLVMASVGLLQEDLPPVQSSRSREGAPFQTITIVRIPEVIAKYAGIIHKPARSESLRLSTAYLVTVKMITPKAPAIHGAMNQAAKT